VELIIINDLSDPELARRGYRRLLQEHEVDLVLSPYSTPLTLAASEVTEEAGYVMVASGAAGRSIWDRGYRYIFATYATADRFFIGFLDLVARHGLERVGILYETNPFNRDAAEGAHEWIKKFGLSLAAHIGFYPNSVGRSEYVQRVKESNTEALIICSYPDAGYALLSEISASGWRPPALAMTITPIHPDFYTRAGQAAERVFAPSQWEPMKRIPFPGTARFIETFRQSYDADPSYHAASAYASGQILERAVRATGSLHHSRLRRHILTLDTVTIIGRFKVDADGRQIGHNPLVIQWQEGRKEIVYPRLLRTAPPQFRHSEAVK
jgi:branched-chain amino acid transport system substrate-binding protein